MIECDNVISKEECFSIKLGKVYRTKAGYIVRIESVLPRLPDDPFLYKGTNGCVYDSLGTPQSNPFSSNNNNTDPIFPKEVPEQEYLAYEFINSLNTTPSQAFENLRLWGEKIFGPVIPERIVERAQEEMDELAEKVKEGWTPEAVEEAADVVVILTRAPGLWEAIVRKMEINFNRKWNIKGDGTGYHVPKLKLEQNKYYVTKDKKIVLILSKGIDRDINGRDFCIYLGSDNKGYNENGLVVRGEKDLCLEDAGVLSSIDREISEEEIIDKIFSQTDLHVVSCSGG